MEHKASKKRSALTVILSVSCSLAAVTALLLAAFCPLKANQNDGGTVVYYPLLHCWEVHRLHRTAGENGEYMVGTTVYLFGNEVFDNSEIIIETL